MAGYPDGQRRGVGGSKNYSVYPTSNRAPTASFKAPKTNQTTLQQNYSQPIKTQTKSGDKVPKGTFNNPVGGYVVPTQTYTGHTSSRTIGTGENKESIGVGGGRPIPIKSRPDATSILARPDLQRAQAPKQFGTHTKGSLDPVQPVTNRNTAIVNALRAPAAPSLNSSTGGDSNG